MSPPATALTVTLTVEQLWQPAPGGSGTYVAELARALATRPDVELHGLAAREGGPPALALPTSMDVRHSPLPRPVLYEMWARRRRPLRPRPDGPGVVHATTWAVPPRTSPLVVTVHDLAFLRDPEHFTARGNSFFRRALRLVQDEADAVVVPSAVTAADCAEHGLGPDRVTVVPHGVRILPRTADDVAAFRTRHGLERPYVLWCGTLEPRKNLGTLLAAYERLHDQEPDLDLVLVGPAGWGGAAADVARHVERLPEGRVHLLGRLDEADLHSAYAGAEVFCFPSTWEGFGMPVLEAQAHGVPVVTSAGTSMAEVAPTGALLVDPADADALAGALLDAVGRRPELAAAAAANAARFSWERCADEHVAVYRTVAR